MDGIRVVIFDLDGVVVDTMPDIVIALRAAARAVGYGELSEEQTAGKVGGGATKAFTMIFGPEHEHLVPAAVDHFRSYYTEHCANASKLYPGIEEVLQHFHGKAKIAMATAKIRSATENILTALGVRDYFDWIVSADDMQRMKPDPQCVEMILEHFAAAPDEAVIIGDMATDIQAGQAAGIHTIGVSYGYGALPQLQSAAPDLLITEATELLQVIQLA